MVQVPAFSGKESTFLWRSSKKSTEQLVLTRWTGKDLVCNRSPYPDGLHCVSRSEGSRTPTKFSPCDLCRRSQDSPSAVLPTPPLVVPPMSLRFLFVSPRLSVCYCLGFSSLRPSTRPCYFVSTSVCSSNSNHRIQFCDNSIERGVGPLIIFLCEMDKSDGELLD